ncbi:MAG TPA: enoyl-CoA hydratase, partial [Halieaceae bacterium]|nr:enoyl-CoA hydratase [Halieaceae bacterium]
EPARGIHATGGATFRITERAGWGNAMYHLLTSDVFDAQEAYRIGLVQEVVPAGQEYDRALELAQHIANTQAPLAIQATKASARRYLHEGVQSCIEALDTVQAELMLSEDAQEGVRSFVERRQASFQGR